MGNTSQVQSTGLPEKAFRILKIERISTAESTNLSIFTDYIISPNLKTLDLTQPNVDLEVYSILDGSTRTVNLQIEDKKLGMFVKAQSINQCLLKITKVFPGSPFDIYGVHPNEYIVAVIGSQYKNLKEFVTMIKTLFGQQKRSTISFAICSEQGSTRMVDLPMKQLNQWKRKGFGLLGCELAQGWINQWKKQLSKPFRQQNQTLTRRIVMNNNKEMEQEQSNTAQQLQSKEEPIKQIPIEIVHQKQQEGESQGSNSQSQQVQRKCNQLMDGIKDGPSIPGIAINPTQEKQVQIYNNGSVVEVKYKGTLKNQVK